MTRNQLPFVKPIRRNVTVCMAAWLSVAVGPAWSITAGATTPATPIQTRARSGQLDAEARLLEVYRLMGVGGARAALEASEKLVKDYPTFQLAQLVYGDLLSARVKPVRMLGEIPADVTHAGQKTLEDLRAESQLRVTAVRERPPLGSVPAQFVGLSPRNKHAIAIDVSNARLYLFENSRSGVRLVADYYMSVGKAGVDKSVEGDQRTPLGTYFITSNLDPRTLKDLYGVGALPINYPNALDVRRGKTGSGIWLHGTPSNQFSRAPRATDGCVAVANPDLQHIIKTVETRTTPVAIAKKLHWVRSGSLASEKTAFEERLRSWATAKSTGEHAKLMAYYAPDFLANGKDLRAYSTVLENETLRVKGRVVHISDISLIRSGDDAEIMIATFGEVISGAKSGRTLRQYWERRRNTWKILYEGVV